MRRLLKKHPELVKSDTTYRADTIFLKGGHVDTTLFVFTKDTIVIREGRVTQKYFYNTTDSTVYINCNCEPDTIIKQVPVIVNTVQPPPKQKGPGFWEWIGICFALIVATFLGTKISELIKNRKQKK